MAKVTFSKLKLKLNTSINEVKYNDDITFEVRQYLPHSEKAALLQWVLNNSISPETKTNSPIRSEAYYSIAICQYYGQMSFTDKQLEDISKTYDLLECNGIVSLIRDAIPQGEIEYMDALLEEVIRAYVEYANSFAGMMANLNTDAEGINAQLGSALEKIGNAEGLELLQEIQNINGGRK